VSSWRAGSRWWRLGVLGCVCVWPLACTLTLDGNNQGPPLTLQPATLPTGVEGSAYSQTFSSDGKLPAKWEVAGGSLPPGLSLSRDDGVLAGTPTAPGTYSFVVAADDASRATRHGEITLSLTILPRLTLATTLPFARVGIPYSGTPTTAGGVPPYQFNVIGLPGGLTFDATAGTISGTPLNAYPALSLDITVTDSGSPQQSAASHATLVIKPPPVAITTTQLADGRASVSYHATLTAVEGRPPYGWIVKAGLLPDGLSLNLNTGVISGKPTESGTATFTIQVTDNDSPVTTDSREFTITIAP
jgi:large repetitive protein